MPTLVLSHAEIEELLSMGACIGVMEEALADLARGRYHQPLRRMMFPPGAAGLLGMMPAYRDSSMDGDPLFGLKAVGVFGGNPALGKDAHQGAVLLFSGETGELIAVMNASAITAIRTAAVSAVATKLLARRDAGDLAIVGAGVQAATHLAALALVRPLRRVRVASRRTERARSFASSMQRRYEVLIEAVESVEDAVRGADLIVTATSSADPVLRREWISPGAHLNVVGSSTAKRREVGSDVMAVCRLFVDRRESTENESGEYIHALREGAIRPGAIQAELGELLLGSAVGRGSPDEITLFKSLGLATEDLAAAAYLLGEARRKNAGTWVEF